MGTPSERARRQNRWILSAAAPECLQEDVPGVSVAGDHRGDGFNRLFDVSVLGALRRLRAVKRSRNSAVRHELCDGCSHEQRHGWSSRTHGTDDCCHRANSDGWRQMGAGVLMEDVPHQVWGSRIASSHMGRMRSFAPLCPQKWATIALAYIKEMDYISNRRVDAKKAAPALQSTRVVFQRQREATQGKGKSWNLWLR